MMSTPTPKHRPPAAPSTPHDDLSIGKLRRRHMAADLANFPHPAVGVLTLIAVAFTPRPYLTLLAVIIILLLVTRVAIAFLRTLPLDRKALERKHWERQLAEMEKPDPGY